jgi:hypothetical protein
MGVTALINSTATHRKPRFIGGLLFLSIYVVCAWMAQLEWRAQPLVLLFGTVAIVCLLCFVFAAISALVTARCNWLARNVKIEAICGEDAVKADLPRLLPGWLAKFASAESHWDLSNIGKNGGAIMEPEISLSQNGQERVVFRRRCRIKSGESPEVQVHRTILIGDPLGLFCFRVRTKLEVDILVKPAPFEGHSPQCLRSIAEAANAKASVSGAPQGDMTEMREYREGDSVRLIVWKILAKTGGMRKMVRVEERVEAHRCALYFMAGVDDERAASFIQQFLLFQKKVSGDWVLGVSGFEGALCRSSGSSIERKVVQEVSKTGFLDATQDELLEGFSGFLRETKRLRIENPVVVVGGAKDHANELLQKIRQDAPRCGMLWVPQVGDPVMLN